MATLEALRGKLPELSGLDDEHAIEFIRRVYYPDRQPAEIAASLGYKSPPPEAKPRNGFAVTNDTVIDFANAAAGGIGAAANFVSPGNRVSKYIDENIVAAGKAKQSDATRAEDARYAAEMEAAQGFGDEVGTTLGYVARNPLRSVAQAAGSFVGPGASVKAMQLAARGLGAGAAGITRAGLAGGAMAGGAMAGGDAAGTAYELAIKAGATEEEATAAARQASMIPGAIGAAGGLVGAERVFAGGKGFAGGRMSRALKTGAVEAGQEGIEEGVTQYEGQRAAMPFDPNIDPMKGVGGAATMGAVLGGITGGSLAAMSPGDQLRTEGLQPEIGPFTRSSNKVVEAAANVLDNATTALGATPPKPLVGNEIDYTPEPITGNLAIGDAQEIARQNIAKFAARHEPIAQADAQAMVARAEAEGKPMVAVPHPEGGGFTVVPRQWVTAAMANPSPQAGPPPQVQAAINAADDLQLEGEAPRMAKAARTPEQALQSIEAQGTVNRFGKPVLDDWSRLADAPQAGSEPEWIEQARAVAEADQRAARAAAVAAAPVDRAPRTPRAQPAPDAPQADLVATYVDQRRNDGTPAGRAFAQDFDAGRITRADVQGLIDAARPQSADDRLAAAAAQAPKPQALQPGDLLNPKGEPFKNQRAATTTAQREGGSVIVVDGGWAVRKATDAPATGGTAGAQPADAGRSARVGVLRDERPADLPVSAERPADEGAEQPAAAVVRAGSAAEPAPALSPDADLPTLKKAWSEAAAAGDTELAREINDRIVALKKAPAAEPKAAQVESDSTPSASSTGQAPVKQPAGGFDSAAWVKAREDRIKASREAGNTHLDKVPAYVETMRGKRISYVHDTKVKGKILTVDNNGRVYVEWLDAYSQEKEGAVPMQYGKKTVMQTSLGPTDLKDYFVDTAAAEPTPIKGSKKAAEIKAKREAKSNPAPEPGAKNSLADVYERTANAKYPGRDNRKAAEKMAAELGALIDAKNADGLIARNLGSADMNPASRAVFEAATGVTLPKGRAATEAAIDAWAGVTSEQRAEKQEQKRKSSEAKAANDAAEWAGKAASAIQVKMPDGDKTGREWVDDLIAAGYTRIVRRGPKTYLANSNGEGFAMLHKDIAEYARKKSATLPEGKNPAPAAPESAAATTEGAANGDQAQEEAQGLLSPSAPADVTTAGAAATHKDPGEPAEPVTPAVVEEAIKTAVSKTDRKPSEMKADLLAQIDAAVQEAPDYTDFQVVVKSMGLKDATEAFTNARDTLGDKAAPRGYSRPKRTFKIEGDGTFTVNNTVRQLLKFRAEVVASKGFVDRQAKPAVERASDALDRRGTDAAIANMIDEGDFQAASDFADLKGVKLDNVKLTKVLRERLDKWMRDTEMAAKVAERATPAGQPAPAAEAAPDPSLDLKGFERTPLRNGAAELRDGDFAVRLEPTVRGLWQASQGSAESSPRLTEQQAVDWADNLRTDMRKAAPAPAPEATPKQAEPAPTETAAETARRAEFQDRIRSYWDSTAIPAIRNYLHAFDAFGADRLERNKIKPEGMSAREWLESFVARQSDWDKGRKVRQTGIQYLSIKDLWPTDDGLGERLRKAALEAVKALKNSPGSNGALMAEAFMEPKAAAKPVQQAETAPVSSVAGQKNLAYRGSRIATLKAMNDRLRKIAPDDAWADKNIENATDLDALQDQISSALVKAERGPAEVNPLRAELDAMSGAELRAIMERMNLAGARMVQEERIAALLAEDPAEVRAAMQQAEPEKAVEPAAMAPMPAVGGISMSLAQQAHSGTSHVPERRAEQERDSYMGALRDAWARAAKVAGQDQAAIDRITEVFKDVADGYNARYTATLQARSRVMSSMITGPARFPVERNRKRMETERKRAEEASEFLQRGIKRLLRAARGPIDNSPESELERVRLNLSQREETQEQMKAANAALRKGDDEALAELGFSEAQIAELKKPDFAGRTGYPEYKLSNNNAEIRRLRERLKSAEDRMADAAAGPVETERQGVRMVEDATDDRLRLIFDGKPGEEVRADLKANGFKWSPKNEAWQRQLTDNARYAAKQVLDKHYPSSAAEPEAGTAFSRARGRGISTRDAKAVVATIRSALPNAPDIVLHETVEQAPEGLQDKIREEGAEDDVEAVYWNGEIHAFPKHMESVERALFVIGRHEVRHHGMRTRYGKKLDETLMGMWRGNQALRQATQAIIDGGRARPSERLLAIEEALADLPVAEIAKLKGFDRFVAAMRDWLRMTAKRLRAGGFGLLADAIEPKTWTDADVAAFVLKAEQVSGKGGTGTAFSRIAAMKADIDRAWRDLSGFSKFSDFDTEAATKVAGSMDDFVLSREDGKRWAALNVREFKRDDGQTVYSASLEVGSEGFQKGTGAATTMYLQALNVAQRRGMGWQSEGVRSDNAMAIYRRLTEGGVPFKDADGSAYVSAKDLAGVDLMAVARAIAGDRPLPQFSRRPDTMAPAVTIDRDADTGAPVYATDDITIGFPQKTERFEYLGGQNLINYSIGPADGFDSYGMVELEIGPDGVPIGLADIEIKPEYRGRDIGAKVVEAILAAHPGLDLDISNIVEGARGFWSRLGIPEQNRASGEAYDGTLNWQTFSQAQNARRADRAGARGRAAGEGRNAKAEGGAPGAGGQAPGQAQGGVARFSRATGMAEPWADKALSAADTVAGLISKPESIVGQTKREYTPEQSAAMKQVGFQVEPQKPSERIKALMQDAGKKIAQGVFDQFAPVKELSEKAYMLLRLSKGASGAFEALLKGGKLKITDGVYDFDEKNRGGVIKQLLTPLQGEHHDFLRWVAANRAERLAGDGKENLFTPESIAALKSLSDGVTSFDYTIQTGDGKGTVTRDRTLIYADAQRIFNGFQRNVMDMAEQSGLIDGEMRQMWEHEFYVPFYRVEDDGSVAGANIKNGVIRQQAFKALTGRSNKLNADLLDNTLMNWAHLLDAAAKNRAAKASIEAAENAKVALPIEGNMGKGSVWFMEDGQKRWSFVDDPYLMTAISALQYGGLKGPAMQALSSLKHMLTIGVTASPFFKVRNLIRDSVQVIASSPIGVNPVANVVQGWKNTGPESDQYFRLLAGGGTIHFGTMMEGSEAKRVQALVESGVDASNILDSDKKVKAFYRKFIEPGITAYNELGNRGEAVNRAALYSQLIDQGVSHAEASLLARDLMDFSMSGSFASIRFLTQVVPFFNARLQGLYKLGRAAKEDPKRFSQVLGTVALISLGLLAAYGDDDDWKKREEWDRNNYWWFKFGGTAIRIPKPFEIGAIATLAERSAEYLMDDEMNGKRFRAQLLALLGDNLAMNPIPQAVKPMLDVYANKDSFSGRPIETMGMDRLKSEYRVRGDTSMAARGISSAANSVTGLVGKEALSPVQIDHLIRGYFGWLGMFVVSASDIVARPATGQTDRPAPDYWKRATGGMVADLSDAPSRYVSQVYEQAKEIEQAYGTWRDLQKQGRREEADEFRRENTAAVQSYKAVERAKARMSHLNAEVSRIEKSEMGADEKRLAIRPIRAEQEIIAKRVPVLN